MSTNNFCTIEALLALERRGILSGPTDFTNQVYLNRKTRTITVDWICQVCIVFKLMDETYFLAVHIFDRMLESSIQILRENVQAYAVASLCIASKKQEICGYAFDDYVFACGNTYKKDKLIELEKEIFLELGGDFNFPGHVDMLHILNLNIGLNDRQVSQTKYFLALTTMTQLFHRYLTSVIASSCHHIVCKINTLASSNIFNLPGDIINLCASDIVNLHNKYLLSGCKSIARKYDNDMPKMKLSLFKITNKYNITGYCPRDYLHQRHKLPPISSFKNLIKKEKLGEGTFGTVKKIKNRDTGTNYAIKKVHAHILDDGISQTHIRETSALLLFQENTTVVSVLAISPNRLLLEYMDQNLSDYIKNRPDITWIIKAAKSLLEGLSFMHTFGMMHRDIKPENILVSDGTVKFADFGFARGPCITPLKAYTSEVCTLYYRAPEILLGSCIYDQRIDVWSLGCVFYEMTACHLLFCGDSEIDQLYKIFRKLGTPTQNTWPGVKDYKDYNFSFPLWEPSTIKCKQSYLFESLINVCLIMPVSNDPQPYERLFARDVLAVFDFVFAIDNNYGLQEVSELFFEIFNLPLSKPGKLQLSKIFENYIRDNKTLHGDVVYLNSIQARVNTIKTGNSYLDVSF
jgi:cyclin-dependent kinase 2